MPYTKQMLLNKQTTSENTQYPTKCLRTLLNFAQKKRMFVLNSLGSPGRACRTTVSIKNVLDNVFNFLVHPPAGLNCDASTVSTVRSLRKQVLTHHVNNKKQSMLDDFVTRM